MASCAICDKPALFRCGKCKVERYCSRECQKDHWPHHKIRCVQLGATAKSSAVDQHAAVDATELTQRRPQPPPAGAQVNRQSPSQTSLGEPSGPPRGNPRAARLLGQLPPSLQPEPSTTESQTIPDAAPAAAATPRTPTILTCSPSIFADTSDEVLLCSTGPNQAQSTYSGSRPSPPQHQLYPSPPPPASGISTSPPQHQSQSPLGPSTPLPLQPAPPSASPPAPPGRASHRFIRPQLRDPTAKAAADAGGLQVDGPGGLQVEGSGMMSSGTGSALDHVTAPRTPAAKWPFAAVDPRPAPPLPTAVAAPPPPPQQQQRQQETQEQLPLWPWAARCAAATTTTTTQSAITDAAWTLSELPPEVLLEVMKALPACSLAAATAVCRTWRRAAREPWLWIRQLCAAGYPVPASAYVAQRKLAEDLAIASPDARDKAMLGEGVRVVPGVRGVRAMKAVRAAAGGSSHEDFLGGLRAGFLDRLQNHGQQQQGGRGALLSAIPHPPQPQQQSGSGTGTAADGGADLKGLYGRIVRMESNWRCARYAESSLREHSSNVECLAFQRVDPWGEVLLSAAWDGSVRVFSLGPGGGGAAGGGAPQQTRCVRRYRGHTGWITCMAAGRQQVVTASTDRRVAAWRYYSESSDPWVALEHPQEVTLVRFCYAPPHPTTTNYLAHHICTPHDPGKAAATAGGSGSGSSNILQRDIVTDTYTDSQQSLRSLSGVTRRAAAAARPNGCSGPLYDGEGCSSTTTMGFEPVEGNSSREALTMPYDPQWEDWVVTGCIDGVIRLWHLPTKQQLRTFTGHGDVVWGIAVLHGSSIMVSSSRDCTTKLWQLPPFHTMQAAAAVAPMSGAAAGAGAGAAGNYAGVGGGPGTGAAPGAQLLEAMATLSGHTSAILCMDVHRVPAGVIPPSPPGLKSVAAAVTSGTDAGGGDGYAWRNAGITSNDDMIAVLSYLLNTGLVDIPAATASSSSFRTGVGALSAEANLTGLEVATAKMAALGGGGGTATLPVWLAATGGADAVVRVWNLSTAQCHVTLRRHSVGVLSVQFGYLPRHGESYRNQVLLPPDLNVMAAPPSLALPAGQYGGGQRQPQYLPPSHRLVLLTGSVREVLVWDPISGDALAQLSDHNGPVTSVALVHGVVVTLAMNDGLIVYKCNGVDEAEDRDLAISGGGTADDVPPSSSSASSPAPSSSISRRAFSGTTRLRRAVTSHRKILEAVICLQDAPHHSFSAALALHLEGLAVGSGTGDITYLDFRPYPTRGGGSGRAAPLPLLPTHRRSPQQE